MARDFIKVNTQVTTATHAHMLLDYANKLRIAYDAGKRLQKILEHNHDGSVFTDIEELCGLPAGKGQIVFDLINGSVGSMEGVFQTDNAKSLTEVVG